MHAARFQRTLRSTLFAGLLAGAALSATFVAAAPPASRPAVPPMPGDWKGKSVLVRFDVDLDEDGLPTPEETQYLVARFEAAGARVVQYGGPERMALVVIGRVAKPEGDAANDPIAGARFESYPAEAAKLKEAAAAASVRVVTSDEIGAEFKLGRPSLQKLREVGLTQTVSRLSRRLPEVKFFQIALSDTLEFFTDVTGVRVIADREALKAAGVDVTAPVTLNVRQVQFATALALLVDSVGSDKVTLVCDGTAMRLTSVKAVEALRKAEPGVWNELADLQPESDADTGNYNRAAVKRHLPELRFTGTPLSDVMSFMSDVTGLNLYVSWPDLEAAKIAPDAPVNLDRRGIATDQALAKIAADLSGGKLVFYCDRGEVFRLASKAKADAAVKADKNSYLLPVVE